MIHIIIGTSGEFSERIMWIAGAFTDEANARKTAESRKIDERSAHVIWTAWNTEFHVRAKRAGLECDYYYDKKRPESAAALGLEPEPMDRGCADVEYTVISVPIDVQGRWDYDTP